ncbi:PREDICTED: sister chromatid cohesion [Prunus dulcis]|uniref:PREDICTED: sister chromatid cohesion n=1 Tax=Prunus dulcis TaxID=3755 RepID=A0A5E4EWT9_PRUDU|nr:PREDICTED: sister chromatid cohesion [Prunus dulcis]
MKDGPRGLHWARPSRPNQFMPGLCDTPERYNCLLQKKNSAQNLKHFLTPRTRGNSVQKLELKSTIDWLSKGQREFLILASTIEYFLVVEVGLSCQFNSLESPICCDENYHDPQSVASVIKIATGNMEVAPKLDKLRSLLFENPYISEEDVENGGTGRDGRKEHRTV